MLFKYPISWTTVMKITCLILKVMLHFSHTLFILAKGLPYQILLQTPGSTESLRGPDEIGMVVQLHHKKDARNNRNIFLLTWENNHHSYPIVVECNLNPQDHTEFSSSLTFSQPEFCCPWLINIWRQIIPTIPTIFSGMLPSSLGDLGTGFLEASSSHHTFEHHPTSLPNPRK